MTELRKHPYLRGDVSGWCGECQLPKANRVHDLVPAEVHERYELNDEEAL